MSREAAAATGAVVTTVLALLAGCSAPAGITAAQAAGPTPPRPTVLAEIPHDPTAFTQGLELARDGKDGGGLPEGTLYEGTLYEGTGIAGSSQLRELDPVTGEVRRAVSLPGALFGEGITVVGPRIWQLTWQDGVALEWDRATFALLRTVPVEGEGWGLCRDGDRLVRSDGTDRLRFHDPETFAETGSVSVTRGGVPVGDLNELECVEGQVWANVWRTDTLVRIDPVDGRVTVTVDASGLLSPAQRAGTDVMNGIAWLGSSDYLLTGKWWPSAFRVRLPG